MRHRRAVEKLRILAEACERVKLFWFDTEPFLKAVYAFGEVLDGADPLDAVQVAVAINLPPAEVPWESTPEGADWLADELRLRKGGFLSSSIRPADSASYSAPWPRVNSGSRHSCISDVTARSAHRTAPA